MPDKPSFDGRLEAVVQTLELVATMHRDHEIELAAIRRAAAEADQKWTNRLDKILTSLEQLAQVAHSHERRLTGLEGPR